MNFDISRMQRLMSFLGNPQDSFPSIHIAGTNGKGSTAAMISNSLIACDFKTGLYTSPHLVDIRERFQINGQPISPADLSRLAFQLRSSLHSGYSGVRKVTQFEFLTALAFLYFAEQKVQIAVVEVGLGGRLDATNVLKNVLVSVITNIGLDHTQWLGSSIEKIAGEKAGIVKPGIPVVTGSTGRALNVISKFGLKNRSRLIVVRPNKGSRFGKLTLKGEHQKRNAGVAFEALKLVQSHAFLIANSSIIQGINGAHWPGRYEELSIRHGKFKRKVILDGAHNPAAMDVLVETLKEEGNKKVDVLFGVLKDKDYSSMIRRLAPMVEKGFSVPVSSSRSEKPSIVAAHQEWEGRMQPASSVKRGFENILAIKSTRPLVVTGSLYLVGEVRKLLRKRI